MEFKERFRWGWAPATGKKGDLMSAQHMLAVCKPGGIVATVMPHGVLSRGGAEKEIRKKFLEQDLIEAVIGLPPNLFYGAGIPAIREATGTTVRHTSPDRIGSGLVLRPPPDEQSAIVARLREIDSTIDTTIRDSVKLRCLKLGLMADLLTGRVRVPETLETSAKPVDP
jgi:hypothetical protein